MTKDTVLMFTKDNEWCRIAREFVAANFDAKFIILKNNKQYFPDELSYDHRWGNLDHFDFIISYLCPKIIPKWVLDMGDTSINFHPAPPKYPGIGGYNFAIYNGDTEYGVTMHYIVEKVNSGEIIVARYFPMFDTDTVKSLKDRSMTELLSIFFDWMGEIVQYGEFNSLINRKNREWEHEPYTHEDLIKLYNIDKDLFYYYESSYKEKDIERLLRATYFENGKDGPYIEINGKKWRLTPE